MYAASSHHRSPVDPCPPRSCLKKSAAKKNLAVRFALPHEASANANKLLAPPPRVLELTQTPKAGPLQQLAQCIRPAAKQLWLACGVLGTYHTLQEPSGTRVAILGMCFVLPASRTLANHGVRRSMARLLPPYPLEYFVATAAASAGIYVGLASGKS